MFGILSAPLPPTEPPKNVPPPTPINFPRYPPELIRDAQRPQQQQQKSQERQFRKKPLTAVLQGIVRPADVDLKHFQALGLQIQTDADLASIIPDHQIHVPEFSIWDAMPYEEARNVNQMTQRPLSNGGKSPGIQTYLDRCRELSTKNSTAFRTVRRMQPVPGQPPVRLGNTYEFFRNLENFSTFWDDTSIPPTPSKDGNDGKDSKSKMASSNGIDADPASVASSAEGTPDSADRSKKGEADAGNTAGNDATGDSKGNDGDSESSASSATVSTDSESKRPSPSKDAAPSIPEVKFYRTGSGTQMPPEFRLDLVTAFLKLVSYDFGCNVSAPRVEPRLYLNTGTLPTDEHDPSPLSASTLSEEPTPTDLSMPTPSQAPSPTPQPPAQKNGKKRRPSSYFSSGCIFVFRTPNTREAARAGILEGPVAAVSARHTTSFAASGDDDSSDSSNRSTTTTTTKKGRRPSKDVNVDLARELVAALLTAQHRAREGRFERRTGDGQWWATKRRWGGGTGWALGQEIEVGADADEASPVDGGSGDGEGQLARSGGTGEPSSSGNSGSSDAPGGQSRPSGGRASAKRARHHGQPFISYLSLRPPSSSWDRKMRYLAIGQKKQGVQGNNGYDDIFLVSALFHHISIVRVRVPQRLLRALDGEEDDDGGSNGGGYKGGLEMVRSPWYDMFQVADRLAALKLAWGMMAYMMRAEETGDDKDSAGGRSRGKDSKLRDGWGRPGGSSSR